MTQAAAALVERMSVPRVRMLAAFAAIYLFWGGTFLAIRYAVAEVPPLLTIAIRCAGGAAVLYAWLAARGRLQRTTAAEWRTAAIAGVLLFVGCHGVMAWAEQRVPSGQTALFMSSIPLWLVVLNAMRERRPPPGRVLAGLAAGTLGVIVLTRGGGEWSGAVTDHLALIACSFSWAAGSLVGRHGARPESAAQSTAMQLAAGAVAVLTASAAFGEFGRWDPSTISPRAVAALIFLIVCGTVLGFGAYTWLLRVTTPAAVGSYSFVNPLIALGLAWAVGDESPSGRTFIAAVLVIGAVLLTRDKSTPTPPRPSSAETRR
ncbi:MAG TPA: EamA family transporter [Thermoanaerobaculia bacterium]|jgi:drug/metabolite transporter (DMT)-like permease|nr:EamA family transporter [Thermoanaerobaculia bacterium]